MKDLLLIIFLFSIFMFGCGGSQVDTDEYTSSTFYGYSIKTVAILPIRNNELDQKETKEIDDYFVTGISKKQNEVTFLSPEKSIEKLIKDNLDKKYYNHVEAYSKTKFQNVETLKEIGRSLKCDAIYQGVISDIIRKTGETTATVEYLLFSTSDGKVLRKASSTAHKKKSIILGKTPPVVEVVKMAMEEIIIDLRNTK